MATKPSEFVPKVKAKRQEQETAQKIQKRNQRADEEERSRELSKDALLVLEKLDPARQLHLKKTPRSPGLSKVGKEERIHSPQVSKETDSRKSAPTVEPVEIIVSFKEKALKIDPQPTAQDVVTAEEVDAAVDTIVAELRARSVQPPDEAEVPRSD